MRRARTDLFSAVLMAASLAAPSTGRAQLTGHGGPVRALAISEDGATALSGSFDASAIRWSLGRRIAEQVLRLHDSAVNAVALLKDGRAVTAGADARVAVWTPGAQTPDMILEGHAGPVAALSVSPDGQTLASASWDHTVRLWSLGDATSAVLEGHRENVNAVAFMLDGKSLVSAGYDATVRIWPLDEPRAPVIVNLPAPLNAVAVAPDGEIAVAGADGRVYFLSKDGHQLGTVAVPPSPITSLAMRADGERIAAASADGSLAIIDRRAHALLRRVPGSGVPVWTVAFLPDGRTLLAGGGDRMIHRWDAEALEPKDTAASGAAEDPLAIYAGDPGAKMFRACVACHALKADEGNRAGPNLHGLFGRRIATLPGYNFSPALKQLDIVWTPETVARLFEIGPAAFTPGTKMPEQRIGRAEDRDALVKFLERATQ